MSKRSRFVLAASFLSLILWGIQLIIPENRMMAVVGVTALAYLVSAGVLFEDLKGVEWLTVLMLPTLYVLGAGLFSLFLPDIVPKVFGRALDMEVAKLIAFWVKIFFWALFGVGFYALYLTENIFSVAAIRTIQLLRAAHTVGFLLTLLIAFFLFQTMLVVRPPFWALGLGVGLVSLLLLIQGNWSVQLKEGLSRRVWLFSIVASVLMAQLGIVVAFWPMKELTASLMLVTGLYVILGLSQQELSGRLFRNQIIEYLVVGLVVLVAAFYITSWR